MKMENFPWKKWMYLESRWLRLMRGDGLASEERMMAMETTIGERGREWGREKIIRMDSVRDGEY
jgi:hypothetical protein